MGEVYRPEKLVKRRGRIPDLPEHPPIPIPPPTLETLLQEVRSLREELEKIKRILKNHGIPVE